MHQDGRSNHRPLNQKIKLEHPWQEKAPSTGTIELQETVSNNALVRHPKNKYRPKHRSAPVVIKREVKHGEGGSKAKPMASNDDTTCVESLELLQLSPRLSPKRQLYSSTGEKIKFLSPMEVLQLYGSEEEDEVNALDDVRLLSKHDWIERARKNWDLDDDDAIRSQIESEKLALSIHIYGSSGEGYGAILRDSQMIPIVASCGSFSHEDSVSTFYTCLNGVALGAKIAAKYQVLRFYFYVPSERMYHFIRNIWNPRGSSGSYVGSRNHMERICCPEEKGDIEKIYRLTSDIISDLSQLSDSGVKFFAVQPVPCPGNEAAIFLSKLSVDRQDMKFAEICGNERFSDILYEDAFS